MKYTDLLQATTAAGLGIVPHRAMVAAIHAECCVVACVVGELDADSSEGARSLGWNGHARAFPHAFEKGLN